MDKRKYCRAAVLDTERVMENEHAVRPGALAEEVTAKTDYAAAYIRFFLGNVMKCESVEELRAVSQLPFAAYQSGSVYKARIYRGDQYAQTYPAVGIEM